jgi:hypothetical protein
MALMTWHGMNAHSVIHLNTIKSNNKRIRRFFTKKKQYSCGMVKVFAISDVHTDYKENLAWYGVLACMDSVLFFPTIQKITQSTMRVGLRVIARR